MGPETNNRHMHTEKRRRDRIAQGFEVLRTLVPTADRRADKAAFLQQVVSYIQEVQGAIQEVASAGGLDSFPEETRWQIRLLLPMFQPEGAQGVQAPTTNPEGNIVLAPLPPSAERQEAPELCQDRACGEASGLGIPRLPWVSADEEDSSPKAVKRPRPQLPGSRSLEQEWSRPRVSPSQNAQSYPSQQEQGTASSDADTARTAQLQQLLLQLQAQQAANSQQLQLQQAALMRHQMFSSLGLTNLLQANALEQRPAAPQGQGHVGGLLMQSPASQMPARPAAQQAKAQAVGASGFALPASPCDAEASLGHGQGTMKRAARQPKVRSHTTVAQFSASREDMPRVSPESLAGRPDRSTSSSGAEGSP